MTRLDKDVRREVPAHLMHSDRDIVITLKPDGTMTLREKGRRKNYEVSLQAVLWMGIRAAAQELRLERKRAQSYKRRNGCTLKEAYRAIRGEV